MLKKLLTLLSDIEWRFVSYRLGPYRAWQVAVRGGLVEWRKSEGKTGAYYECRRTDAGRRDVASPG
jgi:hypothetical protein